MKVVANPSHAFDENGDPAGAVPWPGDATRHIGASLDMERSKQEHRHIYKFSATPVIVPTRGPMGQYFIRKLEERELLPACDVSKKYAPKERS
jgi:hypothetical protein